MGSTRTRSWSAGTALAIAGSLVAPVAASAAPTGGPPPPVAVNGHQISLVAAIPGATDIAFVHGRVFVSSLGDEKSGKGAGIFQVRRGKTTMISPIPAVGIAYSGGRLFATSSPSFGATTGGRPFTKVIAWSNWRNGKFRKQKVIFQRPMKELFFLEKLAVGPDGRLYMGSSAAGDKGPVTTKYSGLVLSMKRDGTDLKTVASGLRQPFAITFLAGDPDPWLGEESDEKPPKIAPDFLVHARPGSAFGFPGCQWFTTSDPECAGLTPPSLYFPQHATPTGLASRGHLMYIGFFGGTTKAGPEIRKWVPNGPTTQVVRSPIPLVGIAMKGRWLYFNNVAGLIYRVKT